MLKNYILQNLLGIDQQLNAILGGYADETLSSRAWRMYEKGKIFGKIFKPLIDTLLWFDPDHCYQSYLSEKNRRQLPPEFRR